MRISDWSSDVCSSDLGEASAELGHEDFRGLEHGEHFIADTQRQALDGTGRDDCAEDAGRSLDFDLGNDRHPQRSEEHTSELQSLMRTSYAVFCLKNKKKIPSHHNYD